MGYSSTFFGAVKITPRIQEPFASRLSAFLWCRHMRRSVPVLKRLYPDSISRAAHTLFGDGEFGEEGRWYLPDEPDFPVFRYETQNPEGLDIRDTSREPKGIPSLYSHLALVHDDENGCSYLGWDGGEKAYQTAEWIRFLASELVRLGYHLSGRMLGCVEYDILAPYTVIVDDDNVQKVEQTGGDALKPTYGREFSTLLERSRREITDK